MEFGWALEAVGDGSYVLIARGDLDIAAAGPLLDDLAGELGETDGGVRLVLDLTEVSFIDSTGLRALLELHQRYGSGVRLGPMSPAVARIVELTATAPLFDAPSAGS